MRYFDASALAKIYLHEPDSLTVRRLLRGQAVATSRLSQVEIASALARRAREGAFTAADRDRGLGALNAHVDAWVVIEMTAEVCDQAQRLLVRHRLRSGDAIQLASCLYLQRQIAEPVPLIAFDARLNEAALAEGVPTPSRAARR